MGGTADGLEADGYCTRVSKSGARVEGVLRCKLAERGFRAGDTFGGDGGGVFGGGAREGGGRVGREGGEDYGGGEGEGEGRGVGLGVGNGGRGGGGRWGGHCIRMGVVGMDQRCSMVALRYK